MTLSGHSSMSELALKWAEEAFGVPASYAYVAPLGRGDSKARLRNEVSFEVGGYSTKRLSSDSEAVLRRRLLDYDAAVTVVRPARARGNWLSTHRGGPSGTSLASVSAAPRGTPWNRIGARLWESAS
jgi:hypothetical protein